MARPSLAVLSLLSLLVCCGRAADPPASRGDLLSLEVSAANGYVKAGAPAQVTAKVAVHVGALDRKGRPPANLALVVDTSGSMEGKAIDDARTAALALIDSLLPKDRLAVVVFNSKAELLLPSTLLDDADMKALRANVRAIRAEGTTDMTGGLQMGVREVTSHLDPEGINRVILLGDGVPNDPATVPALAANAGQAGVSITALGLGADYDETLMGQMAQVTGGKFQYVDDSSKVKSFFAEEVARIQKTYARDAWLELAAGPGVTIDEVVGQEFVRTATGARVHVGDLALGEKMDVIVKLHAGGKKDGAPVELMDAVLRFSEGIGGSQSERRAFLGVHATDDAAKLAAGSNADVIRAASRAKEAADTLEAIRQARASDVATPSSAAPSTVPLTANPHAGVAAPRPAPRADLALPDQVRRRHDEAMQVLQKH